MNPLEKLFRFLDDLEERNIFYKLSRVRPEALLVELAVPGERWEIEFFADGNLDVEVFRNSEGKIGGEEMLASFLNEHTD